MNSTAEPTLGVFHCVTNHRHPAAASNSPKVVPARRSAAGGADADRGQAGAEQHDDCRGAIAGDQRDGDRGKQQPEPEEPERGRLHLDDPRTSGRVRASGCAPKWCAADRRVRTDSIPAADS